MMKRTSHVLSVLTMMLVAVANANHHDHNDDRPFNAVETAKNLNLVITSTVLDKQEKKHDDHDDDHDDDDKKKHHHDDGDDHNDHHDNDHHHDDKKSSKDLCEGYADALNCGLKGVKDHTYCSLNKCKALVENMKGRSCAQYCASQGRTCLGAWEEVSNTCEVEEKWTCNQTHKMFGDTTKDVICECSSPDGKPDPCAAASCPANSSSCTGMSTAANCPARCAKGSAGCLAYACKEFAKKLVKDLKDHHHGHHDDDIEDVVGAIVGSATVLIVFIAAMIFLRAKCQRHVVGTPVPESVELAMVVSEKSDFTVVVKQDTKIEPLV